MYLVSTDLNLYGRVTIYSGAGESKVLLCHIAMPRAFDDEGSIHLLLMDLFHHIRWIQMGNLMREIILFLFNKIKSINVFSRCPTQKYLCQTDTKEKSSANCSHMYVQHVMYVDYYLKECKSTEWKFPVLTFLTLLLSGGCGLWSWARYEFAELFCWAPDCHVLKLRCSHGTRRGARRRLGGGLAMLQHSSRK